MASFWLDEIQFDTGVRTFDESWGFDHDGDELSMEIDTDYDASIFLYKVNLDTQFVITVIIDIEFSYAEPLPLIELVPEKFRSSPLLRDYLYHVGLLQGKQVVDIKAMQALVSVEAVPLETVQNLANLIGYEVRLLNNVAADEEVAQARSQLARVVGAYKIKGTYQSIQNEAYKHGLTIVLYDMYTTDYQNFVKVEWFVGDENENPVGLGV